MRPVDPRLLVHARSTRWFIGFTVVVGALTAGVVIAQAWVLSQAIVDAAEGRLTWAELPGVLAAIGLVFAARAGLAWVGEAVAFRAAASAKHQLRSVALRQVLAQGPAGPVGTQPATVAALVTRGIDGLDAYFARYLLQLVLAVVVPIAILATILGQDPLSAVIIAVTLPLIPVFMILVGWYTRNRVERQWRFLAVLSGHFLDLIAGLPTLKSFGRAKAQVRTIRVIGDDYRRTTLGVLRVAFLSSLVLELLASLSVALVAVSMGLRLAQGEVGFPVALFVLVLAPEAYLPLRLVGQHFHAAAEGLGAAEQVFDLMKAPGQQLHPRHHRHTGHHGHRGVSTGDVSILRIEAASVRYGRGSGGLEPVSFQAPAGSVTVILGPSGAGKSTLLAAILGFVPLDSGSIWMVDRVGTSGRVTFDAASGIDGQPVVDVDQWRHRIGWVPQQPHLVGADATESTSIREVVRLGRSDAPDDDVWLALHQAGLAAEIEVLPARLDTEIGAYQSGLSVGQRQRLALARALVRRPQILLLDEPTAALDGRSEAAVVEGLQQAAADGAIVIAVAHRPALVGCATQLVRIEPAALRSPGW